LRRAALLGAVAAVSARCATPAGSAANAAPQPAASDIPGASAGAVQTPAGPPATVRIGVGRQLAEAGIYIALERGYFAQQGVAVELVEFGNGVEAIQHLLAGQLEASVAGFNAALFNALARGLPIKMVVPGDTYYPDASTIFLMVRSDLVDRGEVRDYRDLAGRRIGVTSRAAFAGYLAVLALRRGGLEPQDAELVELSLPDTNAALASGAVDVAVQIEPLATLAAERGIAAKWRAAGEIRPGVQGGGIFFAADLLGPQADVGRRWLVAYLQGARDYDAALRRPGGRRELAAILSRYTAVTDASLYDRMAFPYLDPNGYMDEASLAEQLEWYVEQGVVPGEIGPRQALDPSFAEFAVQRLGRKT